MMSFVLLSVIKVNNDYYHIKNDVFVLLSVIKVKVTCIQIHENANCSTSELFTPNLTYWYIKTTQTWVAIKVMDKVTGF